MTKTQIKAQVKKLLEKVQRLQDDINDMRSEVDDVIMTIEGEVDEVQPYEGHDDLTEKQQAKVDYLEELNDMLRTLSDDYLNLDLEDTCYDIEDKLSE